VLLLGLTILLGKTRTAPGSLGQTINLNIEITETENLRQAPNVPPLSGQVGFKGDGNREGGNVSGRGVDRQAVGSTTFLALIPTTTHVASRIVRFFYGSADEVIAALYMH
jgi:hypothetical protein